MGKNDWRQAILDNAIEVKLTKLPNSNDDSFLTIKETLTRIGIPNFKTKHLYQSAHILHKKGRYYIVHFKQLFMLDGKCHEKELSADDYLRLVKIALMLEQWGLCEIVSEISDEVKELANKARVYVLPYKKAYSYVCSKCGAELTSGVAEEKPCDCEDSVAVPMWTLESKYTIGKSKGKGDKNA